MTSFFACLGLVILVDPLSVLLDLITGFTPFLKAEVECKRRLDMVSSPPGDSAEVLVRFLLLARCELLSSARGLSWKTSASYQGCCQLAEGWGWGYLTTAC